MPGRYEKVGDVIRKGIVLFAPALPFSATGFVSAIAAASISKLMEIHDRNVSDILSLELPLSHISYVEPHEESLVQFYAQNPVYPALANDFAPEISENNVDVLSKYYPFLYSALILKREVPRLLFHREISENKFRELAQKFETLSRGYQTLEGKPEMPERINLFAAHLFEVLNEIYEGVKEEGKTKQNQMAFELIDYIREIAVL